MLSAAKKEFIEFLRQVCNEYKTVLIFDEVITGFRLAYDSSIGYFGIKPDMVCFGKIIGSGMPVGAYGGKKEMTTNSIYMDELLSELFQLNHGAIGEIHDSEPNGISLPKLSISDEIITKLTERWNTGIAYPKRGLYRNYVEQTIVRYAQDRQGWKKKFGLDQ